MLQIIETTDEQKRLMYNKLTKKELISMLIEANKHLSNRQPTIVYSSDNDLIPYHEICSCKYSGGSCNCTMANEMVRRGGYKTEYVTELIINQNK